MANQPLRSLVMSLLILLLFPVFVQAEETGLGLNELIDKANPGDVIELGNRVYEGDVVVDKSLTIIGEENTTIKGTGEGDVITLTANGVTLENLRIIRSGMVLDHDHAAVKIFSDENTVINNLIEESLHGIFVEESNGNELLSNTVIGNTDLNPSRRGNGIHLFHTRNSMVKDNTITHARDGIYFSFAEHSTIERNDVSQTRYGLHYMYSDSNEFYYNNIYENVGGAAIMYSDFIRMEGNQFYDHHDLQSFGVLFQTANNVEMVNNEIHFNQTGIFMDQSNRNVIKHNHVTNNQIGLDIWSSSIENVFSGNHFLENRLQYASNGGVDQNDWNDGQLGNAWSDHVFMDFNEDGISDSPYQYTSAFGEVIAKEQLGILFLDSPALQLYEHWNGLLNPLEIAIEDDKAIQVTESSNEMHLILLSVMTIVLLFSLVRKNRKGERRW